MKRGKPNAVRWQAVSDLLDRQTRRRMKCDYSRIPRQTIKTLEAIAHGDEANLAALPAIMLWLRHHAPRGSYGSPAALADWPRLARMHAGSKG